LKSYQASTYSLHITGEFFMKEKKYLSVWRNRRRPKMERIIRKYWKTNFWQKISWFRHPRLWRCRLGHRRRSTCCPARSPSWSEIRLTLYVNELMIYMRLFWPSCFNFTIIYAYFNKKLTLGIFEIPVQSYRNPTI
jgi:hypothetical protein